MHSALAFLPHGDVGGFALLVAMLLMSVNAVMLAYVAWRLVI